MSTPFIGTVDNLDKMHFMPVITNKDIGKKSVDVFWSKEDVSYEGRIRFKLNADETTPFVTGWGIDEEKDDPVRRSCNVTVTDPRVVKKLREMDDRIIKEAFAKSKEWWKKELTEETLRARYKPIVDYDAPDTECRVKFKVVVPHTNPEPLKKYPKASLIFRKVDEDSVVRDNHTVIVPKSEIICILRTQGIWFMGDSFGMSFTADKLVVRPHEQVDPLDEFSFGRKFVDVTNDAKRQRVEDKVDVRVDSDVVLEDVDQ